MRTLQQKMPTPRASDRAFVVITQFTCGVDEPETPPGITIDISDSPLPFSAAVIAAPAGPKPENPVIWVKVTGPDNAFCICKFYKGDRVEARRVTDGSYDLRRVSA